MALPSMGLYSVENPLDKAQGYMSGAAGSFASMSKNQETETKIEKDRTKGAMGGGMSGAALGVPLAPMTGGLSIPAGFVLGGIAGYFM